MIPAVLFLISLILTYFLKSHASRWGMIDTPTARSSHHAPTPRGGGIAIVTTFYAALFLFGSVLEDELYWALWMGMPVALISFFDDLRPLDPRIRLGVHVSSAAAAIWFLGGADVLHFGLFELSGPWLNIAAVLIIVWLTNLYNFLDGLDGYAGAEGIFVALGAFALFGGDHLVWLAAAVSGFLVFNWHKASIFMGDVGSATLGFIFAVLLVADAGTDHFTGWLILLSLFWFDATVTLLRRWRNREQLTQPHKKHMYQRLHQSGFSHPKVVLVGMSLNLLLLGCLYFIPHHHHLYVLFGTLALLSGYLIFIDARKGFQ